jgi:acylphosphatase
MPATTPERPAGTETVRLTAWVRGSVQGVGFRWWTRSRGLQLHLVGTATNLRDGRVEIVAEGPREACEQLLAWLGEEPSTMRRPGSVTGVAHRWSDARGDVTGFREH